MILHCHGLGGIWAGILRFSSIRACGQGRITAISGRRTAAPGRGRYRLNHRPSPAGAVSVITASPSAQRESASARRDRGSERLSTCASASMTVQTRVQAAERSSTVRPSSLRAGTRPRAKCRRLKNEANSTPRQGVKDHRPVRLFRSGPRKRPWNSMATLASIPASSTTQRNCRDAPCSVQCHLHSGFFLPLAQICYGDSPETLPIGKRQRERDGMDPRCDRQRADADADGRVFRRAAVRDGKTVRAEATGRGGGPRP